MPAKARCLWSGINNTIIWIPVLLHDILLWFLLHIYIPVYIYHDIYSYIYPYISCVCSMQTPLVLSINKMISIFYLFVILHNQWWCRSLLSPVVKVWCSLNQNPPLGWDHRLTKQIPGNIPETIETLPSYRISPSISREIYPRTKYYTDNSSYTRVTPSGKK